ncbi:hypothetical protein CTEN210_12141 [Chaetoceros tenuissimus]|uniref:Uncharacterized protein n=1 Tax=Chaetoceros tenuissimus TaxID=426638 RepID=A0AAD3D2S1_9STRA|nr:hypothetical protein CTEN210_12141 [Chaetoceros tenuissimus]
MFYNEILRQLEQDEIPPWKIRTYCGINEPIPDDDFLKLCREYWDTRWFSYSFAVIAPRISGSISALSSTFILYIIYKSPQKLKSTYHRIMAAMSIYDIWSSTSLILGVLLFPKDIYYRERYRLPDSWTIIGNVRTCEYEAFSYLCGSIASAQYIAALCLYYLCSLVLGMKKDTITKWIEWFLHLLPNASAWSFAITMLVYDMLNPSNLLPWCTVGLLEVDEEKLADESPQMWYCFLEGREGDCIQRGSWETKDLSVKMLYSHMFVTYSIIAISLMAICFHVARVACQSKVAAKSSPELEADYLFKKQASKTVVMHSILYILSMTLPSIPGLLNAKGTPAPDTVTRRSLPLIFTPLGGLFSMFTFVWGKVHGIRLLNPNMSRIDAFKSLFANTGVSDESVFFSNLELIDNQAQKDEAAENIDEDDYDKILRQGIANASQNGSAKASMLDHSNITDPKKSNRDESNNIETPSHDPSMEVSSSSYTNKSGGMALSWGSSIFKMSNNEKPQKDNFYQDPNFDAEC